jgi:hypothetical protein
VPAGDQLRSGVPERGELIVLYSPHFDAAPPVRSAFDCPAAAVHLIGFEGARSGDSTARVLIRTLRHPNARREPFDAVLPQVMIRLVQRMGDPVAETLPLSPPWVLATDSSGYGQIIAPPGIYRVQFHRVGFRSGEGVLQLRPAAGDSLHVYMDAAAIC